MSVYVPPGAHSHPFVGGVAVVYADRTCRFFPVWCPFISTNVSRSEVASALRQKRQGLIR